MKIAIGLGSSLGDRRATLERAVMHLAAHPDLDLLRVSRWYRSPPMKGGTATGWFLNGVALYESRLAPHDVLRRCRALEDASGRRRARWWGDRPLDLDILVAEGFTSDDPELRVPHPGIAVRPFVFWPLREVWPEATSDLDRPAPPRLGMVAVGAFARRGPAAYRAVPLRRSPP